MDEVPVENHSIFVGKPLLRQGMHLTHTLWMPNIITITENYPWIRLTHITNNRATIDVLEDPVVVLKLLQLRILLEKDKHWVVLRHQSQPEVAYSMNIWMG